MATRCKIITTTTMTTTTTHDKNNLKVDVNNNSNLCSNLLSFCPFWITPDPPSHFWKNPCFLGGLSLNVHVQVKGWKAMYVLRGRGHYYNAYCRGKGEFTSCSEMPDVPCLVFVDFLFSFLRQSLFFLRVFPSFPWIRGWG